MLSCWTGAQHAHRAGWHAAQAAEQVCICIRRGLTGSRLLACFLLRLLLRMYILIAPAAKPTAKAAPTAVPAYEPAVSSACAWSSCTPDSSAAAEHKGPTGRCAIRPSARGLAGSRTDKLLKGRTTLQPQAHRTCSVGISQRHACNATSRQISCGPWRWRWQSCCGSSRSRWRQSRAWGTGSRAGECEGLDLSAAVACMSALCLSAVKALQDCLQAVWGQ